MIPAREHWKLLDRKQERKAKRTSHLKVRTGCITCKARHIKCDEGKPLCVRCEKAGFSCKGYAVSSPESRSSTSGPPETPRQGHERKPVSLQPRPLQKRIIHMLGGSSSSSPWHNILSSPFSLSGQDVAYFDAFRYHVVDDLNSWLAPGFWDAIVMRECIEDETVRHAVLSLAALNRAGEFPKALSDAACQNPENALQECGILKLADDHYQAALIHYGRAIYTCRQCIDANASSVSGHYMNRLLISTIIFVIIEMMQGNVAEAINLVHKGLYLIRSAHLENKRAQTDQAEWKLSETMLARFSIVASLSPLFLIDQDAAITVRERRGMPVPSASQPVDATIGYWDEEMRSLQPLMLKSAFGHSITNQEAQDFIKQLPFHERELGQWHDLVNELLEKTEDTKTRRSLLMTKIQVLITKAYLTYCNCQVDLGFDAHKEDFRNVVNLASAFTDTELTGRLRFTVDFNLFPWLAFTIVRCRDRVIRKQALDTFIRLVFRHGGWGNLKMIKALDAIMKIDDQWTDEDENPANTVQYSWTISRLDVETRKIWVKFDPVLDDSGNFMLVHEVVVDY